LSDKRYNVLFIDDEKSILDALKRQFYREVNYNNFYIINPLEAIDVIKRESIDIVVSDVLMPEMDGIDLLVEIKDKFPNIPRILLTAQKDYQTSIRAIEKAEVFGFLTKPWKSNYLIGHLNMAAKIIDQSKPQLSNILKGIILIFSSSQRVNEMRYSNMDTLTDKDHAELISRLIFYADGFADIDEANSEFKFTIPMNAIINETKVSRMYTKANEKEDTFIVTYIGDKDEFDENRIDTILEKIMDNFYAKETINETVIIDIINELN
jgi:response regulator RpfG family c-di-GMP phosphodiesterase